MKITPLEIRQHAFEKIFRGYNIDEVDTFLANISQEWDRVLNESKMLRMQLEIAEKEASKLREIEMTLFKTLKTAEDTSTMITEQANQQADKHVQDAHSKGESIIAEAKNKATEIIKEAENRAKYIKEEVLGEVKGLERDFRAMDSYKDNLLVQMKSLANATLDHVERFESKFDKEGIQEKFKEATTMIEQNVPATLPTHDEPSPQEEPLFTINETPADIFEEVPTHVEAKIEESIVDTKEESVDSLATEPIENVIEEVKEVPVEAVAMVVEEPTEEAPIIESIEEKVQEEVSHVAEKVEESPVQEVEIQRDDLKIIEGIGPRIEEILNYARINTFKDLATTPAYKIKEILTDAGSRFASHDPTTWAEQAKLAAENNWGELKILQDRLAGGRPEQAVQVEPPHIEVPVPATPTPTVSHEVEHEIKPIHSAKEQITEEMLEKVNKVKAAIRKSMLEKADNISKDNTPLPTVNDVVTKNEGGSFFDNL